MSVNVSLILVSDYFFILFYASSYTLTVFLYSPIHHFCLILLLSLFSLIPYFIISFSNMNTNTKGAFGRVSII